MTTVIVWIITISLIILLMIRYILLILFPAQDCPGHPRTSQVRAETGWTGRVQSDPAYSRDWWLVTSRKLSELSLPAPVKHWNEHPTPYYHHHIYIYSSPQTLSKLSPSSHSVFVIIIFINNFSLHISPSLLSFIWVKIPWRNYLDLFSPISRLQSVVTRELERIWEDCQCTRF